MPAVTPVLAVLEEKIPATVRENLAKLVLQLVEIPYVTFVVLGPPDVAGTDMKWVSMFFVHMGDVDPTLHFHLGYEGELIQVSVHRHRD